AQQRIAGAGAERDKYVIGALAARATGQGLVLTLGDILFDTGRAELKPGAAPTIKRLADFLQRHPDRTVLIEGYTDSTGSTEINRWLSEERAQAVRAALIGQGMDPSRIQARGRGAADPVASNDTAAGRQQNRRVEISFPRSVDRTVSR
ncbi:MAG TPA: OmpA family protein, partial [Stellaceae bacterium]